MAERKFNIELAEQLRGRDVLVTNKHETIRGPIIRFTIKTWDDGVSRIDILSDWIYIQYNDPRFTNVLMDSEGLPNLSPDGHPVSGFGIPVEEFEESLPVNLEAEFVVPFFYPGSGTTVRVLAAGDNLDKPIQYRLKSTS